MGYKNIVILGSTGSIGINTLKVIDRFPERFRVVGLTAYNNYKLLEKQVKKYSPRFVAVGPKGWSYLKKNLNTRKVKLLNVEESIEDIVSDRSADIIVIGIRGSAALRPFLKALQCAKTVATANKEAIVIAGDILMRASRKYKAPIIPVDSEQSAIFQCLEGRKRQALNKVYLTASGGSLLDVPQSKFDGLTVKEILAHPRWRMGKKITIDSATLMNKGFEVIEAKWLFGLKMEDIQVIIHPQAIIHSMVEFVDGSILAQLGITDMCLPIQYALTYPERLPSRSKQIDFVALKNLTFREPNYDKFPALSLAIYAGRKGGTFPAVLNAADEEAVEAFLARKISFTQIYKVVEKIVIKHRSVDSSSLNTILDADQWARQEARKIIG